ncbi:MAG: glycosyltransferase [Bacteroidales bacterium]|nr:glycosyltransferase [Bacteroidales bacterium]
MKLSIIIPVHNAERYLDDCLESIVKQDLSQDDYEVILVDDKSTDGSLDKCKQWADRFSNFRVHAHEENHGVGAARNTGLGLAQGDYVSFIDSDDYLNPGGFGAILNAVDLNGANLVRFWMKIISEIDIHADDSLGEVRVNFRGSAEEFISTYGMDTFSVTYLYKREWLLSTRVRFSSYIIGEDFLFISKLMLNNPMIVSTTARIYTYVKRGSSATSLRSPEHSRRCVASYIGVFEELTDYSESQSRSHVGVPHHIIQESICDKMGTFFSRVLTSDIGIKEFKDILSFLSRKGILPLDGKGKSRTVSVVNSFVNLLYSCPFLLPIFRLGYSKVFIPLILPKIDKN